MKCRVRFVVFLLFGTLAGTASLRAHHGASAFDTGKKITLKGTVTEWFWANPHCFLKFDVAGDNGSVAHWIAETSNPPDMLNLGWSKQSLKTGDEITVTIEPVKNGRPVGRVLEVVFADGRTLHTSAKSSAPPTGAAGANQSDKPH